MSKTYFYWYNWYTVVFTDFFLFFTGTLLVHAGTCWYTKLFVAISFDLQSHFRPFRPVLPFFRSYQAISTHCIDVHHCTFIHKT